LAASEVDVEQETIFDKLESNQIKLGRFLKKTFSMWMLLNHFASGLYYKHVTIVNYASSSVNKLRASLHDDARVVIYDHHMFRVQSTGIIKLITAVINSVAP
jgi:hypothetical protein